MKKEDLAGSYLLMIALDRPCMISIGSLGERWFPEGTYLYCGSALNGLRGRVARHLRQEKRPHWHVDHLLGMGKAVGAFMVRSEERLECEMARSLAEMDCAYLHISGFGSSDCRCPGHLFYVDIGRLEDDWYKKPLRGSSGP